MDLNELLFNHQASLMRARCARGGEDFAAHQMEAARHANSIHALRVAMGATVRMTFAAA